MSGECVLNERKFRRNNTLKKLKQMLCKLENVGYEKEDVMEPTVFVRAERCVCTEPPAPKGKKSERANLDGGEAFPFNKKPQPNIEWNPKYQCMSQDIAPDMGCYLAAQQCKDSCMCCECEMAEGTHVHMPKVRDCSKPLQSQCYTSDVCTGMDEGGADCDPNLYPGRWFPNVNATCQFPRPCRAECMDHHDNNDWIVSKPSYSYYLQSRAFKPF